MPRAPYDTSADVYTGPGTATPNAFRFNLVGRLVPISHISTPRPLATHRPYYFTWNGLSISVGTSTYIAGVITYDLSKADYLEIPPGSSTYYSVFETEIVQPLRTGLVPYRRAHLLDWPF